MNHDYLVDFLAARGLNTHTICRTILVKLNARYNVSNLSMIENHIYQTFDQMSASLYTFNYPNEYVLILPEELFAKWSYMFLSLAENYKKIIRIGIGNACVLTKQQSSYAAAQIALKNLSSETNIAKFDDLDLEILLGCVTEDAKNTYLQKIASALSTEDFNLLKTYFFTDMSLKDTAELLFLHKNTLQYKLNRIEKLTGYNPRVFRDAVNLYLAVMLSR